MRADDKERSSGPYAGKRRAADVAFYGSFGRLAAAAAWERAAAHLRAG
jgi:hypothetical protein